MRPSRRADTRRNRSYSTRYSTQRKKVPSTALPSHEIASTKLRPSNAHPRCARSRPSTGVGDAPGPNPKPTKRRLARSVSVRAELLFVPAYSARRFPAVVFEAEIGDVGRNQRRGKYPKRGVPHERFGESVALVCSVSEPTEASAVVATIKKHIADYEAPRHVVFVNEIYQAPNGKSDYRWARETAAAGVAH